MRSLRERQIQQRNVDNREQLWHSRVRMVKKLLFIILMDSITTLVLIGLLYRSYRPELKSCSPQLYGVGVGYCIYSGFFVFRNLFFLVCCFFTSKPDNYSLVGQYFAGILDCCLLTGFTIWASVVVFNPHTRQCVKENPSLDNWRIICMIFTIFNWLYSAALCLLCSLINCIVLCCCCCLSQQRAREIRERIPITNSVI